MVLLKTLESPLDSKEIKPVNPKRNQPWIFTGRTDAEAEAPILWPPDAKGQLTGKDSDAGKDGRQEDKGTTEDEIVGWHQPLSGHEFEQTPRDSEGWRSLVCCCPTGRKRSDTTEWLNNNNSFKSLVGVGLEVVLSVNCQLTGKDPHAGEDWRQEEKGTTEDEIVGWHHWLDGNEFEQAPGIGDRQGSLTCCSPWGHKESDTSEWLNNNKVNRRLTMGPLAYAVRTIIEENANGGL